MSIGAKLNSPYIENIIEPLYNGSLGSNNYSNTTNSIYPEKFGAGTGQFEGNNITLNSTSSDKAYIDSNYKFNNIKSIAIIGNRIIQDTVNEETITVKNIGLVRNYYPFKKINLILRRYNIVQ